MIRRPPRSTLDRSSAASDVYKRQHLRRWPCSASLPFVSRGKHSIGTTRRCGSLTTSQPTPIFVRRIVPDGSSEGIEPHLQRGDERVRITLALIPAFSPQEKKKCLPRLDETDAIGF